MANIQIPKSVKKGSEIATSLSRDDIKSIIQNLKDAQIGISSEELINSIVSTTTLNADDAYELIMMVQSFVGIGDYFDKSSEDIVDDLIDTYEKSSLTVDNKDIFKDFLLQILEPSNTRAINLTRKAYQLIFDRDNLLKDSRVITDVRPLFNDTEGEKIEALTIIYNLRVTYSRGRYSEDENIVFALDDDDIDRLKRSLIRAEKKAEIIKSNFSDQVFVNPK